MDAKMKVEADELLEKLAALLGSSTHVDGRNKTFDEMELAANAIGDRLPAKVLQRSVSSGELGQPEACRCPKCNSLGKRLDEPDPRLIEALRGEVRTSPRKKGEHWRERERVALACCLICLVHRTSTILVQNCRIF